MSISSEYPVSADQIYQALVALGAKPLFDPEVRPEGPQDEDRRRLLGALLTKVELEITAATRLGSDENEGEVLLGWIEEAGPHSRESFSGVPSLTETGSPAGPRVGERRGHISSSSYGTARRPRRRTTCVLALHGAGVSSLRGCSARVRRIPA
ncbi:hypothetical protein ACTPOK_42860 [Streptomyces inhibens]|uniref:hypothetical protein n=1 Tax=Streptomyces inhibens TaxID=2293571 RepID=UPI00402A8604